MQVAWEQTISNAAIAQSVERILGKDEVASSNLASSSKIPNVLRSGFFLLLAFLFTFPLQYRIGGG